MTRTSEQWRKLRDAIHLELHDGTWTHTTWDACRMRDHADRIIQIIIDQSAAEAPAETPGPECWCGRDEALARGDRSGARYDIVCPKHDGLFTVEPAPEAERRRT